MARTRLTPDLARAVNALRHGATATVAPIPGEEPELAGRYRDACRAALTTPASSDLATILADRAAAVLVRLHRLDNWERVLTADAATPPAELGNLARYEAHLNRQLLALVRVLATLQPPTIPASVRKAIDGLTSTPAHVP